MNVNRIMSNLKCGIRLTAAAVLMLTVAAAAHAAENVPVLEQRVTDDFVVLYIGRSAQDESADVRIGTEQADAAVIDGADGDFPIVTWMLVDNSLSINQPDRVKLKNLLSELVAGKLPNERFNLCTIDERLQILVQDSQDYTQLKAAIDSIEHYEHSTYIIDAIDEVLEAESARTEPEYVRIVLIGDELATNPNGLTKEELNSRLSQINIPIYVFGCGQTWNAQKLNEIYALSRQTGGQSWTLSSLDNTLDVVSAMGKQEVPMRATITIPENLKDGSAKGVQLTFSDGSTATAQVLMPFSSAGVAAEPAPSESPDAEPAAMPESESEDSSFPLGFIVLGIAAAAVISVTIIIITRKKRGQRRIKPVPDKPGSGPGSTVVLTADQYGKESGTVILADEAKKLTLSLTDLTDPDKHFECPLRGKIMVGRDNTNQIVLDYDKSVSHKHCVIFASGSAFKIHDLHSRNGTYVEGIRVADEAEIENGSVIKLGRLELRVNIR